jgi:hypothetical protein
MATKASFLRDARSAVISEAHSHESETQFDVETLKAVALFCGIGLIVSLLFATNGLDMSGGFF